MSVQNAVTEFCRGISDHTDDAVVQYLTGVVEDACEEGNADIADVEELVHGFLPDIAKLCQEERHNRLWSLLTQVTKAKKMNLQWSSQWDSLLILNPGTCSRCMPFTRTAALQRTYVILSLRLHEHLKLSQFQLPRQLSRRAQIPAIRDLTARAGWTATPKSMSRLSIHSAPCGPLTCRLTGLSWILFWEYSAEATWRYSLLLSSCCAVHDLSVPLEQQLILDRHHRSRRFRLLSSLSCLARRCGNWIYPIMQD